MYTAVFLEDRGGVGSTDGVEVGLVDDLLFDRRPALGRTQLARLAVINNHKDTWYTARPGHHRLPPILMISLTAGDGWAFLGGPAIKAAATRAAAPWLKDLAAHFFTEDTDLDRAVVQLTDNLAAFYQILYSEGMFMSAGAEARLKAVCLSIGTACMRLRNLSMRAGLLHFKITPKVHKVQHVPMLASCINPRFCQNYAEESLIGTCTKIWGRSMAGRHQQFVQRNALVKKLLGLLIRLES